VNIHLSRQKTGTPLNYGAVLISAIPGRPATYGYHAGDCPLATEKDLVKAHMSHGYWMNIMSNDNYFDEGDSAKIFGPLLIGWWNQGSIPQANENDPTNKPHDEFWGMMAQWCGNVGAYNGFHC
jgi:hypothetical protein